VRNAHSLLEGDTSAATNPSLEACSKVLMNLRSSRLVSQLGPRHRLRLDLELALLQLATTRQDRVGIIELTFSVIDFLIFAVPPDHASVAIGLKPAMLYLQNAQAVEQLLMDGTRSRWSRWDLVLQGYKRALQFFSVRYLLWCSL